MDLGVNVIHGQCGPQNSSEEGMFQEAKIPPAQVKLTYLMLSLDKTQRYLKE